MLKIGSLCTGYGGLDMAVEAYFGAETVWTSDIDKYASIVIKERIGKPNVGDLKVVDWTQVEPVDILTAGYPCQPFSNAGQRKGTNDERHIFPYIMQAVSILRPRFIVLENVRGHLTLGFKEVLKELAETGYDAKWRIIRASDAGAPHRRERLFIIAQPPNTNGIGSQFRVNETQWNQGQSQSEPCQCGEVIANTNCCTCSQSRRTDRSIHGATGEILNGSDRNVYGCGSSLASDSKCERLQGSVKTGFRYEQSGQMHLRRPPNPLDQGRLNAKFVEYMMGLPEGWVTDLPLSRSQQLKILGNGVVPQQAYLALQLLLGDANVDNTSL
jgi:DNA (cytosine-5)-methyltransferase 1